MKEKTRKEKEKETREAEIINAAERLFYKHGFDDVSMDNIAKESEFTKRTLYQYFEHKEDLYFFDLYTPFQKLALL